MGNKRCPEPRWGGHGQPDGAEGDRHHRTRAVDSHAGIGAQQLDLNEAVAGRECFGSHPHKKNAPRFARIDRGNWDAAITHDGVVDPFPRRAAEPIPDCEAVIRRGQRATLIRKVERDLDEAIAVRRERHLAPATTGSCEANEAGCCRGSVIHRLGLIEDRIKGGTILRRRLGCLLDQITCQRIDKQPLQTGHRGHEQLRSYRRHERTEIG